MMAFGGCGGGGGWCGDTVAGGGGGETRRDFRFLSGYVKLCKTTLA